MIRKLIWTPLCILVFGILSAQQKSVDAVHFFANQRPHEQCAHTKIHERLMETNESYREEQLNRESSLDQLMHNAQLGLIPKSDEIFTIPVVVHVIHEGEAVGSGTNISNEQIWSAINALNEDFRKMAGTNGDGDGADIEVEFCLAQRDPDGNATTGINRVSGCSVSDYCSEGITAGNGQGANELNVKDLSRWPNQDYYNIWVVNEIENNNGGSGIQGYAYFPTTSPVDGTVVLYNAFGTVGNLKSYTNRNRTLTHELGHGFALFHTFQGESCNESNCNLQGDRVCDTPPTTLNSSCSNAACSGTQQVENYMDYTSQTCKNMFTEGQKERMRLSIQNSRSNLIESNGCEPVAPVTADAGITEILSPAGNTCSSAIQPIVTLSNLGSNPLSNVIIQYRTGGTWQNFSWTGILAPGQGTDIVLPEYDGGWGNKTLVARTQNPNGGTDENASNNSISANYDAIQDANTATVNITLDLLGGQTTWELRNSSGNAIASGGPYGNFQSGDIESSSVCLLNGCYDFVIFDAVGNGICCGNGNGAYEVVDHDGNVLASGSEFGYEEATNFCFEGEAGDPPSSDFAASQTSICVGSSINFANIASGDIDDYSWSFFGGTPVNSSQANPNGIFYNTAGTFNVELTVSNLFGQDTEVKQNYITVLENSVWFEDADGDGHGNPNQTIESCSQPLGYVEEGDDCDDTNGSSWDECYDCLGVYNGIAVTDSCGTCDTDANNDCTQDCAGIWGGLAYFDDCGTCDDIVENDCLFCDDVNISLVSRIDPLCFGDANGSIEINLNTQEGDFTFLWDDGSSATTRTGLNAGTYQASLTQGDCTAFIEIELSDPLPLSISFQNIEPDDCSDQNSGGCVIVAEGGTAPYTFEHNGTTFNQTTFSNLEGGIYPIVVSDVNGCSSSGELIIETIGCDTLSTSSLLLEYCNSHNEVSSTIFSTPVGEATKYEWELTSPDGEVKFFETATNGLLALNETDIQPGIEYGIRVRGINPTIPSFFAQSCNHTWRIGEPSLVIESCQYTEINFGQYLTVSELIYANNYEYRFDNGETAERIFRYSEQPSLKLIEDSELRTNTLYDVSVRVNYNGIWGGFGESCKIFISPQPMTTGLLDEFCGNIELNMTNVRLELQPIERATVYQTVFTNNELNYRDTIEHLDSSIPSELLIELEKNEVYQTRSRALADDQWTMWGNECQIGFNNKDNNLNLLFYPNPVKGGETLTLRAKGDWNNTQCTLRDITGRVIQEKTINLTQDQEIQFRVPTNVSGLYLLTIRHGKQELTKKLIVD